MTIKLDLSTGCIAKELENLHDLYIKQMNSGRSPQESSDNFYRLKNVTQMLGFVRHCICNDVQCEFYNSDYSRCRCDNSASCRHITYQRDSRVYIDPNELENMANEPYKGELDYAKTIVDSTHLSRTHGEPFILWKSRTANEIYQLALNIHNQSEVGILSYRYDSWRAENREERKLRFIKNIVDVRAVGMDNGVDHSQAVGCFLDGKMFVNEQALNTHVDRARFFGHTQHITNGNMVTATSVVAVRATSSDYEPPKPVVSDVPEFNLTAPITRRLSSRTSATEIPIAHLDRMPIEDEGSWLNRLIAFIQTAKTVFPQAVGCLMCGMVYQTGRKWLNHIEPTHGRMSTSQQLAIRIEPI